MQSPPMAVQPEPAYIAASAASQIVTNDHDGQVYDMSEDVMAPLGETALVAPASLALVNAFLDQLLYSFLSVSRSLSLASLRPAITEILKPALAREAIAGADQELHEYLGGGEDEELMSFHNGQEPSGDWDLEVVWRRTRLRCMVYSSLGDIEEEDEDMYSEQEQLSPNMGVHARFASNAGMVSPAVAIFLTSILEFIGEQTLIIAGNAAYNRSKSKRRSHDSRQGAVSPNQIAERVVVEELDTEKVALNGTFGRLWRSWRKRMRSPSASFSRPISRDSMVRRRYQASLASSSRRSSVDAIEGRSAPLSHSRSTSLKDVPEEEMAALIPLPMSKDDVREIEVPGLVIMDDDQSDSGGTETADDERRRPHSLVVFPSAPMGLLTPTSSRPSSSSEVKYDDSYFIAPTRTRSRSLPTPEQKPFPTTAKDADEEAVEELADDGAFVTPMQSPDHTPKPSAQGFLESGAAIPADRSQPSMQGDVDADGSSSTEALSLEDVRPGIENNGTLPPREHHREGSNLDRQTEFSDVEKTDSDQAGASVHKAELAEFVERPESEDDIEKVSEDDDSTAIGIARTSNVSVPAVALSSLVNSQTSPQAKTSPKEHDTYAQDGWDGPKDASVREKKVSTGQEPHFRLKQPPPSRSPRSQDQSTMSMTETPVNVPGQVSRTTGAEHGAPPLTPLREMMEAAVDTSDEASSTDPSHEISRSGPAHPGKPGSHPSQANAESVSASQHSHSRKISTGSKIADIRQQVVPVSAAAPIERATVQRVYSPPMTPRDAAPSQTRRSDSLTKTQRPSHSAGSGATQGAQRTKGPSVRMSDDDHGRPSGERPAKPQDAQRNFEQLIRSDQTMKYTLTPQTMREIEAPESPRWASSRSHTADLAEFFKTTGPNEPRNGRAPSQKSVASSRVSNGLRSNTHHQTSASNSSMPGPTGNVAAKKYIPISRPSPEPTTGRTGRQVARDARVDSPGLKDFAEFIRSTGPSGRDYAPANGSRLGGGSSLPKKSSVQGSVTSGSSTAPQRTGSVSSRGTTKNVNSKYQPRDASATDRNANSDLIDFIRQGPPDQRNGQTPKSTNPGIQSRTSDRISSVASNRISDANASSTAPTRSSVQSTAQSMGSSLNSQAPLLGNNKGASNRSQADEEPPVKRKQRRVRDPYAIDTDSEEELDLMTKPKPKRQEESLMEFLRNVPPPSASQPAIPSAFDDVPKPGASSKTLQKKTTTGNSAPPAKKSRFSRNPSTKATTSSSPSASSTPPTTTRSGTSAPQLSLNGGGRESPLFNGSNTNFGANADNRTSSPLRSQGGGGGSGGSNPPRSSSMQGVAQARGGRGRSDELAHFLKTTGPPPPTQARPSPPPPKEESGFARMFGWRKKSSVA
ncbi:MAG: hypothetical protein M1833_005127 [Piccolia ochrophora]|nr:MAG: hypothetical protein M1833_005127 [Piccolia ochrophora]